ncbi:MAG: twin-arginine translocase TatA/TatE family subunit, partial [Gemmatimonadota bacterium]
MSFGSIGFSEMLVIAVLVLVFFGPRRMPEIGRAVGGAMREFRRGLNEIQRELQEA